MTLETMETTTLIAVVQEVRSGQLLVCDCCSQQSILVRTDQACCFSRGDRVQIEYSGVMTMSLPPQICATSISRSCCS